MQITFMGGVEWMLFFLASLLLMLLAPWYAPKIGFTELRRIPKIDVLDDVARSQALQRPQGLQFQHSIVGVHLQRAAVIWIVRSLDVLKSLEEEMPIAQVSAPAMVGAQTYFGWRLGLLILA